MAGVLGLLFYPPAERAETWAYFVFAFCGIATTLGSILYFRALQNTVSTNVAQLHYTQIVIGALLAYILWHDIPTWNLIVGSIIIIASGMFIAARARKKKEAVE